MPRLPKSSKLRPQPAPRPVRAPRLPAPVHGEPAPAATSTSTPAGGPMLGAQQVRGGSGGQAVPSIANAWRAYQDSIGHQVPAQLHALSGIDYSLRHF